MNPRVSLYNAVRDTRGSRN